MSISFSGLASGLDTSSWITSLTALKQAKVTTLQQQREELVVSKNTLSSIRSFFTSFRSTLEKITDSRFNILSMNLFAQNLATSANLNVLSATATNEAVAGQYEVKVDKIASNTQAVSKYDTTTTVVETTKAEKSTLLSKIGNGVKSGTIEVLVDGVYEEIEITSRDTIGSFIDKLKEKGYHAEFNEKTGYFITNLTTGDIKDTDSTGIIQELHLTLKNKGFNSNSLTKEEVEVIEQDATASTCIWDIVGINAAVKNTGDEKENHDDGDARTLTFRAGGEDFYVVLDENETIESLVNDINNDTDLSAKGVRASFSDGVFKLTNATITADGQTNFIEAFGLSSQVTDSSMQSDVLLSKDITTTETATGSTKLTALDGGEGITSADTVVVEDAEGNETTISLNSEMTIDGLLQAMRDAGINASISEEGIVSISDGRITGGTVDIKSLLCLTENVTAGGSPVTTTTMGISITSTDTILQTSGMTDTSGLTALSAVTSSLMLEGKTFKISTTEDLQALATIVNGGTNCSGLTFILANDIDLSSIENWTAIGNDTRHFSGTFDGNGYEISGLKINSSSLSQGLFGYTHGATIKNLGLTGVDVTSTGNGVGALVGYAYNSTIQNVYTEGSVMSGSSNVGGLVGYASYSTLTNCQASGTVRGANTYVGGLVGSLTSGTITSSSSSANVSGKSYVGGIAGFAGGATLISVYSTGTLDDTDNSNVYYTGGLAGYSSDLTIRDSWTKASVESGGGSVVGYVSGTALISNTQALSDNYYASIKSGATGTTDGCSASSSFSDPFTIDANVDNHIEVSSIGSIADVPQLEGTYKISTTEDLQALATLVNGGYSCMGLTFVLANDIDLSSISNWTAIGGGNGTTICKFSGTFDGNGYEISGLNIDSSSDYQGLFGYTSGATIKNLGLTGVDVASTKSHVGALVGHADNSTIQNVYTEGSVSGYNRVGGLVGYASYSTLTNCQASGTVLGSDSSVGGLVGNLSSGTITSSSSSANVSGSTYVGGIAGWSSIATLISVYSTGTLDDTDNSDVYCTGGLVGYSTGGLTIRDSWTKASVESGGGSIVGYVSSGTALISNTQALSDNYYASIKSSATGTTENCSVLTADETPFTISARTSIQATSATKFGDMGLDFPAEVTIVSNGTESVYTIETTTTLEQFKSHLESKGFTASFTDGKFTIAGAEGIYIKGELDDRIDAVLNFEDVSSLSSVTTNGTASTTIVGSNQLLASVPGVETNATLDTNLSEIGITDADVLTIEFSNGEILNFSEYDPENFSLSSLMNVIKNHAVSKGDNFEYSMNDGVLTMISSTGLRLSGTIADKLGLSTTGGEITTTTAGASQSSSSIVVFATTATASTSATLAELGITEYQLNIYNSDGTVNDEYSTVLNSGTTLQNVIDHLGSAGITATLANGVLNITSTTQGQYIEGGFAEAIGITAQEYAGETVTTGTTLTSANPVTFAKTETATGDSKLSEIFSEMSASEIRALTIIDHNGNTGSSNVYTLQSLAESELGKNAEDLTVDELCNSILLSVFNYDASISNDGRITITPYSDNYYFTGTLADALGISASSVVTSTTNVVDQTSTGQVTYTKTMAVQGSTEISDFYTGNSIITVKTAEGQLLKAQNMTDTSGLTALSAVTASDMVSGSTFKISTTADLEALATIVNGGTSCSGVTFVMSNDIDLSSIENWTAIGGSVIDTTTCAFSGTFDGNGYEISGLKINSSSQYQGLFGYTDGATIKNLGLTGVDVISTNHYVGALVGYAVNSNIQHVYTEGTVTSSSMAGGLIGVAESSTITSCQSSGAVNVTSLLGLAGGLVAGLQDSTIISSCASVNVEAVQVGGLVGATAGTATLISVYSAGTVIRMDSSAYYGDTVGGLVGGASGELNIHDSYTKATVSAGGSLVGIVDSGTVQITNTQALSDNYYGSITDSATGTTENCSVLTADETPFTITPYQTTTGKINISGMTVDEMFSALSSVGVTGTIDEDGVMSFTSSDGNIVTGEAVDAWGITATSTVVSTTLAVDQVSTRQVTYTQSFAVQGSTEISDFYTGNSIITVKTAGPISGMTDTTGLTALSAVTSSLMLEGKTFKISTTEDLQALATLVNGGTSCSGTTFILANDIDLSSISNWTAIGNSTRFRGTFDGNGYEISGLTINSSSQYQGLFGYIENATIKNLGLTGVDVTSTKSYVGALVGFAINSTIQNVYTEGSVSGSSYVGGLVGDLSSGTITSSSSSADVSGYHIIGGIAGYASGATLISVYSTGTLDDTDNSDVYYTGGLVGYGNSGLTIRDSWTKASVESGGGSIVGYVFYGTALISNTQALSDNYYASIRSSATGTTKGCSASSSFSDPFTIDANVDNHIEVSSIGSIADLPQLEGTYKISTTEDLQALATIVNSGTTCSGVTFVMSNDIDLSSISNWTAIGGVNGTTTCLFSGTFDGNGYEISGLTINSSSHYQGLFGYIENATIKNLGLTGVDVTSTGNSVGALVGRAYKSTIQNVYTDGSVSGLAQVGGLVGYAEHSTLTNCQASGTVLGSDSSVGGLAGILYFGTITSSSSSADVSGNADVGGIAGRAWMATLISVYSTGTLDDTDNSYVYNTGGLVGCSQGGLTIRDSWTKASVESGGGSVVGYVAGGTTLISNTQALSDNYYASINSIATGTTENFSTITADETPFTITPYLSATVDISNMTVDEMFNALSGYGITGSVSADGVISFTSSDGNIVTGEAVEAWGITTTSVVETATVAVDQTSTVKVTYTKTIAINGSTAISDFYTGNSVITVKTSDGQLASNYKQRNMTDTTNLTALSAVTASDMVSGATFKIATTDDLLNLATIVDGGTDCTGVTFIMSNDIDLSSIENWNPIGSALTGFSGTFDGNGYEITGMNIVSARTTGLFAIIYGATIKNLGITGYEISGSSQVGALAGQAESSTITNVYTEGTISATGNDVGGLVGYASYSTLTNCQASGTIESTSYNVGGLVGQLDYVTITSSSSNANVTGEMRVGGIAGDSRGQFISVHSSGTIIATDATDAYTAGGIVGYVESGTTIQNSYTKATVSSGGGAVVGSVQNSMTLTITNSQALSDNYVAVAGSKTSITNCSTISADVTPFTITPYQTLSATVDISGMSVNEMFSALSAYDVQGSVSADGVITISSASDNIVTGEFAEALGITTTSVVETATVAVDQTSTAKITYTETIAINGSTTISDFYTGNSVITVNTSGPISGMTDTTGLTALSAVTASDMVSGRTYKISTTADLEALATIVNGGTTCSGVTFVMTNDIDLSSVGNWTAIGKTTNVFSGIFDGNGYEISGLTIDSTSDYQGLFGYTSGATIKNLGLTGVDVTSTGYHVGALVGCAAYSTIQNVYTEGTVNGYANVGGLVGNANNSNITSCRASGTVVGSNNNLGGLVGYLYFGTITSSSSSANVSGKFRVGGIAGHAWSATLISVYSTGTLDDTDNSGVYQTGGLVGYSGSGLTIRDSWTKASVESGGGSVVGYVSGTALISNTQALSDNYYASIDSSATGTTENCSTITADETPFTITPYQIGTVQNEIDISNMTVDEMFSALSAYDIQGSLSASGQITFSSNSGNTVSGDAIDAWGSYTTPVYNSAIVTHTLDENTTWADLGATGNPLIIGITNLNTASNSNYMLYVTDSISKTAQDLYDQYGINLQIVDGKAVLDYNNNTTGDRYIINNSVFSQTVLNLIGIDTTSAASNEVTTTIYSNITSETVYNTATVTHTLDENTTWAELGFDTGNITLQNLADGSTANIEIIGTMTMAQTAGLLDDYGVNLTIDDYGKAVVDYTDDYVISADNRNVLDALKLKTTPHYATPTSTIYSNETEAVYNSVTVLNNLAENTTWAELGFDTGNITLQNLADGSTANIEIIGTMTMAQTAGLLDDYGVNLTIDDYGKAVVDYTDDYVISADNRNVLDALKLKTTPHYATSTSTIYSNETEAVANSITLDKTLNENTTWADLGIQEAQFDIELFNTENGEITTVTVNKTLKLSDTAVLLEDYNIYLTVSDGKADIDYTGSYVVNNIEDDFWEKLKLAENAQYNVNTTTTWSNSTSDSLSATVTKTMDENSTFGDIGLSSQQELEIVSNGVTKTITVSANTTLSDFMGTLADEGFVCDITDGKITITGKDGVYIKSANSTLFNLLNITDNKTYDSEVKTGYSNGSSSQLFVDAESTLTASTTFSQLEVTTDDNLIKIQKGDETHTITVKSTDTVGDLVTQINNIMGAGTAGISDGEFYINSNENAYISYIDSDIANALNLSTNISDYISTTESTTESTIVSDRLNITTPGSTTIATSSTKLGEIVGAESLSDYILDLGEAGTYTFDANTTIQNVIDRLQEDGITATLGADGKMTLHANGNMTISGDLGELFAGPSPNITTTELSEEVSYTGSKITIESLISPSVTYDTKLSDLEGLNITPGVFNLVIDNVTHKIEITSDSTLGSLKESLEAYDGVEVELVNTASGVTLDVSYAGDIRFETATEPNASNIVEKLFNNSFEQANKVTSTNLKEAYESSVQTTATESTLLSDYDNGVNKCAGELLVNVNGEAKTITITSDETFGSFIDKLADIGVTATLCDGALKIDSLDDTVTFGAGASSKIVENLNLVSTDDLGIMISDTSLEEVNTRVENVSGSVAEYADFDTQLSALGITSGSFSIYRNGQKALISIDSDGTFEDLQNEIHKQFSDVNLRFDNGYLEIYSTTDDVEIRCSASVDTSNITSILGLNTSGNLVRSSREMYTVKGESKLTTSGLFKNGQVTEGTFIVGNATFTIDENTTLNDIIAQINSSSDANATAYWDAVAGAFVIKSRTSGSSLINIEAGTSNFTDIVGFTSSEWNPDGTLADTRLLLERQNLGGNAEFSINGTKYTSTSNTVGSDVTKIKGLTLDLKATSGGQTVTVTVGKDYNSAADAMQEVVDAYNALIENVDKELATDGKLNDESTLKLLRNQIRNLMMSSISGASAFTNLASIGISTEGASANNISTANINKLEFNKEKFVEAFKKDSQAVEHLLVGNGIQQGILTKVENVVENSVKAVTGYFSSAENSYIKQINRLDSKIEKANAAVATYKSRLEQKFQYMDMMISKMQEQFSTFLGT